MRSSSSSKRRGSAMSGTLPAQLAQLTLDFGIDVERLAAGPRAALVAGDHELTDFGAQARVDDRSGEALELRLDVQRRLALAGAPFVAGAEQLADLVVALANGGRRRRRRPARRRLVAHREGAAADVVIGLAGDHERDHRHHRADAHDSEDHDAEGLVHAYILATCGASSEGGRWRRDGRSYVRSSTGSRRSRRSW